MKITLICILAFILDSILGEWQSFHPLVGFGSLANTLEKLSNKGNFLKIKGLLAVLILVLPLPLLIFFKLPNNFLGDCISVFCLYLTIGSKSLKEHSTKIATALEHSNLNLARQNLSLIVSRDTTNLNETSIVKATIESVLENGNDAIFAPLFWFILAGPAGAILYRGVNTLDAMWGYKNANFYNFGWAAAKSDDLMNLIPARLTALSYSILGDFKHAISCWFTQGNKWYSPNAGPVMASGAGALNITLGGDAVYDGVLKTRPQLGLGREPIYNDISLANNLINKTIYLWLGATLTFNLLRKLC